VRSCCQNHTVRTCRPLGNGGADCRMGHLANADAPLRNRANGVARISVLAFCDKHRRDRSARSRYEGRFAAAMRRSTALTIWKVPSGLLGPNRDGSTCVFGGLLGGCSVKKPTRSVLSFNGAKLACMRCSYMLIGEPRRGRRWGGCGVSRIGRLRGCDSGDRVNAGSDFAGVGLQRF